MRKILKNGCRFLLLYVKDPQALYDEIVELMKSQKTVLVEKETEGPIKRACFLSTQVAAVAIQEEQYM